MANTVVKLIPGSQNVLLTKVKLGYAEGARQPSKVRKEKPFVPNVKRRKGIFQ